jgi:dTDP-4-amino-4,6-dideoxygalactose transaminase
MGIEQLKRMGSFLSRRRENYELLSKGLSEIGEITQFQSTHGEFQSSYYCLSILLEAPLSEKRFEIVASLRQSGIGTSVYYPQAVPSMKYYQQKYGYRENQFPVASRISGTSIALPVGPHLNPEDMSYIVQSFKNAISEVR